MPIELTQDPIVLYVHVLHLTDVEASGGTSCTSPTSTVRAFGSAEPSPTRTSTSSGAEGAR